MSEVLSELVAKITADASELKKGLADAEKSTEKSASTIQESLSKISTQLRAVGIAFTAVGVAGLKMVADSKKLNAELSQIAITTGFSAKELRDLALGITNVSTPLDDIIATFNLLARAGVKDADILRKATDAFDSLGDATGSTATTMADLLLPAFKLFGEAIPTTTKELDKFTWMTKNTLVDMGDFGTLLTRMAPYLKQLDLSMEDAIATLAALGDQGITGTAATLKLRTAITQAASSGRTLAEVLDISQKELDGYKTKMEDAVGITDKYAEAANTQFSWMDKLKQTFSELSLRVGTLLDPLEGVLGVMATLGPVFLFASTAMGKNTIAWVANTIAMVAHGAVFAILHPLLAAQIVITKAVTAAQWLWNAAMTANPIGLVIVAVAALIAVGILLWQNWDKVSHFFSDIWSNMKQIVLTGVASMLGYLEKFLGWVPGLGDKLKSAHDAISNMIDSEKVGRDAADVARSAQAMTGTIRTELEKQKADALANFATQKAAAKSLYDSNVAAINKEYGVSESVTRNKIQDAQYLSSEVQKGYQRDMKAARDKADSDIRELNRVYNATIKNLDIVTNATVKGLQDQIDAIDKQTAEEDLVLTRRAERKRLYSLEGAEYEEYEQEIARNELLRTRDAEKNVLRDAIETTQETARNETDRLKESLDANILNQETIRDSAITNLELLSIEEDKALVKKLADIETDRLAAIKAQDEILTTTITRITNEETAIKASFDARLTEAAIYQATLDATLKDISQTVTTTYVSVGGGTTPTGTTPGSQGGGGVLGTGGPEEYAQGGGVLYPGGPEEYAQGGIIPGPIGAPQLAIVHGGETIIPTGEGGSITVNISGPLFMEREDQMNQLVDKIRKGIQRQDRLRFGGAYSGG